jgi:superfamily II DNA or RNA helicase
MNMTITSSPKTITRSDLESLSLQLLRLTNDQRNSLKRVEINDRCVINGAAGTGKTVLAMELARQRCEAGETVALLCSNPNLSRRFKRWTETLSHKKGGRVVAGTPATLPSWAFRKDRTRSEKHRKRLRDSPELEASLKFGYLDEKWKQFIDETVEDLGQEGIFDYLIVDEAQNLCDEVFLKLMDALLKDGLANGRWTVFGDFDYQNIVSPRLTRAVYARV